MPDPNTEKATGAIDAQTAARESDWRVRLSLAPSADYLYKAPSPGILAPLAATDGVVFPYTPGINISYAAAYDGVTPTHTNYKINQYKNSSIADISISAEFTCQDTFEANYLLATIHFFRSMTKMFYGQDSSPKNGTPPPLGFFHGLGTFQFNQHPIGITNFAYALPKDVDYIRATNSDADSADAVTTLIGGQLSPGGTKPPASFSVTEDTGITYVPTKMTITLTCVPILSRNTISNKFSLRDYATGKLMRGGQNDFPGLW
jgi:hypothetical protein|tara:strand:- start:1923 stop:2705 length:783 start_codon:yes stop_codon:yes gene_type:complete